MFCPMAAGGKAAIGDALADAVPCKMLTALKIRIRVAHQGSELQIKSKRFRWSPGDGENDRAQLFPGSKYGSSWGHPSRSKHGAT